MGEKRKADITSEEASQYQSLQRHGWSAQHLADYFHWHRRQMEDDFARRLGFDDRKDAKRKGFAMQLYLREGLVRAHNKKTTATICLGNFSIRAWNVQVFNKSSCSVFLGDSEDLRPRDGKGMEIEPGASLQFPGISRDLFMAADSPRPMRMTNMEAGDGVLHVTVEDPKVERKADRPTTGATQISTFGKVTDNVAVMNHTEFDAHVGSGSFDPRKGQGHLIKPNGTLEFPNVGGIHGELWMLSDSPDPVDCIVIEGLGGNIVIHIGKPKDGELLT